MAHVVTEKCNGCKFTDCVEVCPVACFYEMELQVVIHPDECIDCMACVEVCPVHAIYADADVPAEYSKDIEYNAVEAVQIKDSGAPAITVKSARFLVCRALESPAVARNCYGCEPRLNKERQLGQRRKCDSSKHLIP